MQQYSVPIQQQVIDRSTGLYLACNTAYTFILKAE